MTTCHYFDDVKFDIFDAMAFRTTLSRLCCVLEFFHVSISWGKTDFQFSGFYLGSDFYLRRSTGTELAYDTKVKE